MGLFGFRTRKPQRDRETDLSRLDRLIVLIRQLQQEAATERGGLQQRYGQAQDSAAFTLDAIDNGAGGDLAAVQADSLEQAMQRYRRRIAALDRQIGFMDGLETDVRNFRAELTEQPAGTD